MVGWSQDGYMGPRGLGAQGPTHVKDGYMGPRSLGAYTCEIRHLFSYPFSYQLQGARTCQIDHPLVASCMLNQVRMKYVPSLLSVCVNISVTLPAPHQTTGASIKDALWCTPYEVACRHLGRLQQPYQGKIANPYTKLPCITPSMAISSNKD